MKRTRITLAILALVSGAGCATVKYGDKDTEAKVRELRPVSGKTSLQFCGKNAVPPD